MTNDERRRAVGLLGFSERQAAFLVTVLLHAGVCLGRQYCTFARLAPGQKMRDFFQRLVSRGYATVRRCRHHRALIYHLHSRPLYTAIGEPNSRYRRPVTVARAIERLMLLDAVLAEPDRPWLATEAEKVSHFTLTHRIHRRDLPSLIFRANDAETVRYFADKLPIGLDPDGRAVFVYLVTRDVPVDFRAFLERHADLWRRLPAWTLRLLVPRHLTQAISVYHGAVREQLATPLEPGIVEEFRWYVHARRRGPDAAQERFDQAVRAFGAPRFQAVYRAWRERGDPVVDALSSHTLKDHLKWGVGRWESQVLPHAYAQLLPLVGTA